MAERKRATDTTAQSFSAEERAAMRERAKELKASHKRRDQEAEVLAKIAEMPDSDRVIAEALHALVREVAPDSAPRTWYGMPAYARDGEIVCFFQGSAKFKSRYCTLGFNDSANLDSGAMWPTAFALDGWDDVVADQVRELLTRAFGLAIE